MQSLKEKRLAYQTDLQNGLARILETLQSMPEVEKVVLFGSYAVPGAVIYSATWLFWL